MGANTPSPASTPGWVWDLSVSIAQLTLRAHELGAAAEFLGAANKAFVARAQERPKPTEDELRLAADVERDLRRHLGGLDREQTEEVKNAADQVVNLLSRMLRTHDPVVALARNPDGFLDYVYTHGGKQLRGQFGGRAKAVFTDLLKVAVYTCARYAPGRQDLTPYVTAEILRVSDRTEGAAARISSQLDDIQETQSGEPVGGTLARYRHRIEPLYPADFRDRDSDRARAARIARGEHGPWWWTGGPWTGKTALMASLLIDPPATEVATAAFFVLGREAGANSRRSFYTQVIPQLAELAGRSRISIPRTRGRRTNPDTVRAGIGRGRSTAAPAAVGARRPR